MLRKIAKVLFAVLILFFILLPQVKGADINDYSVIIEDDADLLTDEEEQNLKSRMTVLTEFGNVLFKTTNYNSGYASLKYIQNYYYNTFGNKKGLAFYIDLNKRQICACASGGLDKLITNSKCDTIMDNVYSYARKGNYYQCAIETFSQMNNVLNGKKIAESMKYICNAILSIMISLFVSYGFIMFFSKKRKVSQKEMIEECIISLEHSEIEVNKTGTRREYSPMSSGSSGGGGSFGRRRSEAAGGGGFSGSGGSHGF